MLIKTSVLLIYQ